MKHVNKQILSLLFMIGLIVITASFIFKDHPISMLLQTFQSVNPFFILIGILMMFIFVGCEAFNTFSIMRTLGQRVSYIKCLGFAFVGFYFSSITPSSSGGQPAQMFYMSKAKIPLAYSSLNLLLITVVYQIVMMIYGMVMFLFHHSFITPQLHGIKYFLFFSITINSIITIAILMAMFSNQFMCKFVHKLAHFLAKLRLIKDKEKFYQTAEKLLMQYNEGATYLKKQPKLLARIFLTTSVQLTASYLVPYFVYRGLGLNGFSLWQIIAAQSLISLAVSSIPLPGAVGASENAFLNVFTLFFTKSLIVPAMLLCRIISFYAFLLISGTISFIVHWRSTKQPIQQERDYTYKNQKKSDEATGLI